MADSGHHLRSSIFALWMLCLAAAAQAAPTLAVGSGSGAAGTSVDIPITFNPTTDSVAGIQFSLTLPASVSTVSVTAGSAATSAGKSVSTNKNGSTWIFVVFGLNQNTIAAGPLLTARVLIAPNALAGNLNLPISGVSYSSPSGTNVAAGASTAGTIVVTGGTGTGSLPTPTLNLPSMIPVNGSLSAGYPAGYNVAFAWTITRRGGISAPGSRVISRASSANFQTPSSIAGLGSYGLTPGVYTITVQAVATTGQTSALAQQDVTLVSSDFSNVKVYPNPWRIDRHAGKNVTFTGLPMGSTVKLFTVSAHWIRTLSIAGTTATWDLKNDSGDRVGSGIYIYLIKSSDDKLHGKLVVIR
jgi:hypothetical protein